MICEDDTFHSALSLAKKHVAVVVASPVCVFRCLSFAVLVFRCTAAAAVAALAKVSCFFMVNPLYVLWILGNVNPQQNNPQKNVDFR